MSPSKENYLKNIFELQQSFQKVTNKKLAEMMHVSAPSVTEMLVALAQANYITHTPYNHITLTASGLATAEKLVKKHRLWEVFLVNKLHYQINNVHQAADALEHSTDDDLTERLNNYLHHPQKCPHGSIIPGNGQGETDADDWVLSDVVVQQQVQIVRILDNREFLDNFAELGLELNQIITVIQHSPFDDSVLIRTADHHEISVSSKSADFIFVEPVSAAKVK